LLHIGKEGEDVAALIAGQSAPETEAEANLKLKSS
jgi:hypothetical protein